MSFEALLVVLAPLGLALGWIGRVRGQRTRVLLTGLALLAAAGAVRVAARPRPAPPPPPPDRPLLERRGDYVGSAACQACHPGEHASWAASYHATMTQDPGAPGAVLGDFGDGAAVVSLSLAGATWHLGRDPGGARWAQRLGDGLGRRPVALLTGSHHMQVAWVPSGRTRVLEQLPLVWHRGDGRWIPRNAAFLRPPEVAAAAPVETGRWNVTCLRCHTLDPRARVADADRMDTRVAELGISCEACHGPGAAHAAANRHPTRRYGLHVSGAADPTIVNPARLPAARAADVCGQCHSIHSEPSREAWGRWLEAGFTFRPGDPLEPSRVVARYVAPGDRPAAADRDPLLREVLSLDPGYFEERFWPDGEVRVTGRELHGVRDSPCAASAGWSCTTCHALHRRPDDPRAPRGWAEDQLRPALAADPDAACVECHAPQAAAGQGHTRHAPGSPGASCVECHTPRTTYGLQQAVRTHRVSSPSVTTALATGRPDACTLCHLDRPASWTAERLAAGWGVPAPADLGADDRTVAAGARLLLAGDAAQRALVAWHAGWAPARRAAGEAWLAPHLAPLLEDPYEAVRAIAWRSLRTLPAAAGVAYDFVGDPAGRAAARAAVLARWEAAGGAPAQAGDAAVRAALLLDPRGGLDRAAQARWLARRDDRRVDIIE